MSTTKHLTKEFVKATEKAGKGEVFSMVSTALLDEAITHLNTVLNGCRTAAEQQAADTAARDWLASIGA